jgi:hypothetical protein
MQEYDILKLVKQGLAITVYILFVHIVALLLGIEDSSMYQTMFAILLMFIAISLWSEVEQKSSKPAVVKLDKIEPLSDLMTLALDAIEAGHRDQFLVVQKRILLACFSTILIYAKREKTEQISALCQSTLLCIADLDKKWSDAGTFENE